MPAPPTGTPTPTLPPPLSALRDEEDERGEEKEKLLAGGLVPGDEEEEPEPLLALQLERNRGGEGALSLCAVGERNRGSETMTG